MRLDEWLRWSLLDRVHRLLGTRREVLRHKRRGKERPKSSMTKERRTLGVVPAGETRELADTSLEFHFEVISIIPWSVTVLSDTIAWSLPNQGNGSIIIQQGSLGLSVPRRILLNIANQDC